MDIKRILLAFTLMFGLSLVPTVNADVIVQYVVVDDHAHHEEPMGYRPGTRLYNEGSRFRHNTYSSHNDYRNRYNAQREQHRRDYYRDNHPPRQYRNTYYSGRNYRGERCGGNGKQREYSHHRDNRKQNHRYNAPIERKRHSSHRNDDWHEGLHSDGRVHITIK